MALYTKESRDRVRDAVDFVELVSARTELRRAGPARYEGLCPFHDERTPSFGIDPVQKVYYCFGCQASGDVFTFVQETEGVDFKEALELLGERYGVELQRERDDPQEAERRRRRDRLLKLLDRTAAYYERYLWESGEAERARAYLRERGLGEEALRAFRVGYAPSAWDKVLLASRRGGFTEQELHATGLAQRSRERGGMYDRFRARIMFPLTDVRGRVLGFGARAMREDQRPKYLNTSDNDVYHKGLHLYGAHLARPHAARAGEVILCEGYTDTIALHQAGMPNAVGLMGTALTAEQVGELDRMAHTVLLTLDADSAGQEAMLRAATLAAKRKLELRVVPLPAGKDPAELIAMAGAEAMREAVARSIPFVRFRVERVLAAGEIATPEGRDRIILALRPVFDQLPASAMRNELLRMVSDHLAEKENFVERQLTEAGRAVRADGGVERAGAARPHAHSGGGADNGARGGRARQPGSGSAAAPSGREEAERAFLALCIANPEQGQQALAQLDIEQYFSSALTRRAAAHLSGDALREPMAEHPGEDPDDEQLRRLLAQLVVQAGREQAQPGMLEVQRLQLELARIDRQIQHARANESGEVSELAGRRAELKRQFDRAYGVVLEATGDRDG